MTDPQNSQIIIGVDTHKLTHVAVAIDSHGKRLAEKHISANTQGYIELEEWSRSFGIVKAFGIEGTGSYGAGLCRYLTDHKHKTIEVCRPNRQLRYRHGKDDSLDAEGAARSVLSGEANAQPKTQSGSVEMIRQLKLTRDTAVKSRSLAMITLKTLIINAPSALREQLDQIRGSVTLVKHIAQFRIKELVSTTDSAKTSMRTLARRWLMLNEEVCDLDRQLKNLVEEKAPTLLDSHGISTMTIAEMLILVGDNPARIKSEAALAKLCGVCPIPASSGVKHRFRLNRGGNRQANAALYRVAIVRMRNHKSTLEYVKKRTKDGKSKSEIIRCLKRFIVREIYQHICRQNPC